VLTGFNGCVTKQVVLHPIEWKDYKELKTGDKVDFVCLTPDYFQEIAKARLGK
jgi:hypothetical protein